LAADAEEYLSVHFREDCDLATISRDVGASPHHLSRVFKRVTGESLSSTRTKLRISFALGRILEGADDLSTVAVDAGFYDHSHLTNSLRRELGSSPTELRARLASGHADTRNPTGR
jgi:AraC-like DNA-binding protein